MRIKVEDPSAAYLVGVAKNKLKACMAERIDLKEIILERFYKTDGYRIECHAERDNNYVHITGGSKFEGFLCHPRTFEGNGWDKKNIVLPNGPYTYPLIDDDNGTRGLVKKDAWEVSIKPENYGNLDWIGENGDVISWRGPSGRQLQMDSTLSYPGFTEFDYSSGVEDHYTPYRNFIYRYGKIAYEFPWGYKVLGAALKNKKLISVVGVDYDGRPNPDGSTGGFYDEVWLGEERIGFRSSSRPTVPWFFNSTATEAVSGDQKLTISGTTCSFSNISSGSGIQANSFSLVPEDNSASWMMNRSGIWTKYRDYLGTSLQELQISLVESQGSTMFNNSEIARELIPILLQGDQPSVLVVSGADAVTVGAQYTVTNMPQCPELNIQWSFDKGEISSNGTVTSIDGCGVGVITASLAYIGGSISGSKQVMLPSGTYVAVGIDEYCSGVWTAQTSYFYEGIMRYKDYGFPCSYQVWPGNCGVQYVSCPYTTAPGYPYWDGVRWWHLKVRFHYKWEWQCS